MSSEDKGSAIVDTIQTIQKGEVPSNDQINATLDSSIEAIEARRKEVALNAHGDTLALDAENTIKLAKEFINEKNADEVFQDLFYQSKKTAKKATKQVEGVKEDLEKKVKDDKKEVEKQAQDIVYVGKRVAYEVIKSRDFRRLLLNTFELMQSIFWRVAAEAKEKGAEIADAAKEDYKNKDIGAEKTLDTAEAAGKEVKALAKEGFMTKEEKDELWTRTEKILKQIQANPDYQQAVNGIFELVENLKEKIEELTEEVKEKAEESKEEMKKSKSGEKAWKDIKTIIERFSGEDSVDPIIANLRKLYTMLTKDERSKAVFSDGRLLVTRVFKNPKVLKDEAFRDQFYNLFEKTRALCSDKRYEKLFRDIFGQIKEVLESIKEDQITNDLGASLRKFASDIALDSNGRVSFGGIQDSLVQLKNLLIPVIARQLTAIPIARIDGSTPKYDFAAENVVFSAYDVLPDYLKLYFQTMINVDLKEVATDQAKAYLRLELNNIKSHLKDIHFAYRRKVFPQIEDEGIADIDIGGKGLSVQIDWVVSGSDKESSSFKIKSVNVDIDDLTVTIKKAQHDILDKIAVKVFNKSMKNEIEDELQVQLKYFGRYIADSLNDAFLSVAKPVRG